MRISLTFIIGSVESNVEKKSHFVRGVLPLDGIVMDMRLSQT